MNVRFAIEALNHIAAIQFYIGGRNPEAAARIVSRIFLEAERLAEFPQIGHPGIVPGTCEWNVTGLPYIIVHEADAEKDEIIVLGVFQGAQDRQL